MRAIQRFRELPTFIMFLRITGKFVFGVGLGVLLAGYLKGYGWWIILLSVILGLPGAYHLYLKKK
jgi:hypothetical protein